MMATGNIQATGRMVEMQVSGLVGAALDWAVAKAAGVPMFEMGHHGNWPGNYEVTKATQVEPAVIRDLMGKLWFDASLRSVPWSPSTDWSQGGPLIEKHQIELEWDGVDGKSLWWKATHQDIAQFQMGETPLIATCRAIVSAHLGEVVSVPAELVENKSPE